MIFYLISLNFKIIDIVNKGSRQLGPRTVIEFRRNDFLKDISFPNLKIAYSLITFNFNGNLTMDDDFCRKMSNGVKRVTVGLDVDYDCSEFKKFSLKLKYFFYRTIFG